ncbi:MAG: hypothetical protein ACD_49C00072G0004 [uncultured bacterium (gcode 4)]|uniref:Class I SAM-dependent methyltransferase n=1 Tax=uncultured bacterium (gcode 4) TaxID=1234023 RepID=K2AVT8_9BACT|nr:MAG: hypothetical protein ACD_49C00072G0004 [uncultured bacterium (gcode 4)]
MQQKPMVFPEHIKNPWYLMGLDELKKLYKQGLWDDYVHHNPNWSEFQILTKEFINSLSNFLVEKIESIPEKLINILEVGAGNGRLTYFLKNTIVEKLKNKKIKYDAIDNFSWDNKMSGSLGTPYWIKRIFDVIEMSVDSIQINEFDIIISSWMPKNEDWTKYFRKNNTVKIFILIWKEEDCGLDTSWQSDNNFERVDVDVEGSVCWSDFIPGMNKSKVVAFLRKN